MYLQCHTAIGCLGWYRVQKKPRCQSLHGWYPSPSFSLLTYWFSWQGTSGERILTVAVYLQCKIEDLRYANLKIEFSNIWWDIIIWGHNNSCLHVSFKGEKPVNLSTSLNTTCNPSCLFLAHCCGSGSKFDFGFQSKFHWNKLVWCQYYQKIRKRKYFTEGTSLRVFENRALK